MHDIYIADEMSEAENAIALLVRLMTVLRNLCVRKPVRVYTICKLMHRIRPQYSKSSIISTKIAD